MGRMGFRRERVAVRMTRIEWDSARPERRKFLQSARQIDYASAQAGIDINKIMKLHR
jgi:hypothetical protein